MKLGIEIGGTKLQLAVGDGRSTDLIASQRHAVEPSRGAAGILDTIAANGATLIQQHGVDQIGIGFGGPVDSVSGQVRTSHQIEGWDNFQLGRWCESTLGLPTRIANDCDSAALAEATWGAGQGGESTFFVTVGTGIGGGFVRDGQLQGRGRPAASEIGHLRPGPQAVHSESTVESLASGWGIVAATCGRIEKLTTSLEAVRGSEPPRNRRDWQRRLETVEQARREYVEDLLNRADHDLDQLTCKMVAQAARDGNEVAAEVLRHAVDLLGWAIAQTITLLAPQTVVVGGGVSLIGEGLFFDPLRRSIAQYVFPPLAGSYQVRPAALGEWVVVHGALLLE